MPRAAAHRRRDPIAATVEFQLLWDEVAVEVPDELIGDALLAVTSFPQQPMSPCRSMAYRVGRSRDGYTIDEEGDRAATVATADEVRDVVHSRAHRRAFELASLKGWVRLHGALVDLDGARVLVTGPSGAGKTTFSTRLLLDGADVQGDESVLLRDGESVAVPRPLFLEPGIAGPVPDLADLLPNLPRLGEVAVLDPAAQLGAAWELRIAPIDHVVVLDPGAGSVTCEPASTREVLPRLAQELFPVTETKAVMLRALTAMLTTARCHRLRIGDPREMANALRDVIDLTAR